MLEVQISSMRMKSRSCSSNSDSSDHDSSALFMLEECPVGGGRVLLGAAVSAHVLHAYVHSESLRIKSCA